MPRSQHIVLAVGVVAVSIFTVAVWAIQQTPAKNRSSPAANQNYDEQIQRNATRMLEEGKKTFRFDTFGSEDFWGGKLRLHESLAGEKLGGVGSGVSPKTALALGLKLTRRRFPPSWSRRLRPARSISMTRPRPLHC